MKLNKMNTVKFNGTDIDRVKFNGSEMYSAWTYAQGAPPLILPKSIGKPLKSLYIAGAEGGVGDLNEETGKYDVPITVRGKNIFNWDAVPKIAAVMFPNTSSFTLLDNGARITGKSTTHTQATSYSNGWFRPGAPIDNNFKGQFYVEKGYSVQITADVKLIELSGNYTNNNFTNIYLYGQSNYTNYNSSVRLPTDGTVKRVKMTYKVGLSGRYYPVFTLNSNTLEITNIQCTVKQTDSAWEAEPYEPYRSKTDLTVSLDAPLHSGEGAYINAKIPTVKGTTIIEVNTATAPEYVAAKYKKER